MTDEFRSMLVRRIYYVLIATASLIAVLTAGALTPLDPGTSESLLSQADELLSRVRLSPVAILANNLLASLIMMIPALGILFSAFIVYSTGLIVSALASSQGIPPFLLLAIPFITLYGLLEMLAYGVAVSESALIVHALIRHRLRSELRILPIALAVTAGLLALAALIEFYLIQILSGSPAL
jgi:hypothetical protein